MSQRNTMFPTDHSDDPLLNPRIIKATALMKSRIKDIEEMQMKQGFKDPQPTLVDIDIEWSLPQIDSNGKRYHMTRSDPGARYYDPVNKGDRVKIVRPSISAVICHIEHADDPAKLQHCLDRCE